MNALKKRNNPDLFPKVKRNDPQIIMGIDPGTYITGYGIIEVRSHGTIPIDYGCIRTPTKLPLQDRYFIIFNGLVDLMKKYFPDAIAIETQFVKKNPQSALKLGMARGVAMVAASLHNIQVHEYTPKKAKKSVVGTGGASKEQVQKMVQMLLHLPSIPTPEDAADALALALCHTHTTIKF